MLVGLVFGRAFKGAIEVPATVQLRPTLASLCREVRGSPAPVTVSYQLQLVLGDAGDGVGPCKYSEWSSVSLVLYLDMFAS